MGGARDENKDKMCSFFIKIVIIIDGSTLDKGFIVRTFVEFECIVAPTHNFMNVAGLLLLLAQRFERLSISKSLDAARSMMITYKS